MYIVQDYSCQMGLAATHLSFSTAWYIKWPIFGPAIILCLLASLHQFILYNNSFIPNSVGVKFMFCSHNSITPYVFCYLTLENITL